MTFIVIDMNKTVDKSDLRFYLHLINLRGDLHRQSHERF